MLFVGCGDEAFWDSLLWATDTLIPHGDDENGPHKIENTDEESEQKDCLHLVKVVGDLCWKKWNQ